MASRVARTQAESGANHLTNLRHDSGPAVELPGHVLRHLDGTRDRNALLDILADLVERGVLVLQEDAEAATTDQSPRERIALELDRTFIYLAQNALLLE